MRLDEFTHKHPVFYNRKRDIINTIKRLIYKGVGINQKVERITRRLYAEKERIYKQYLFDKSILDIACGRGDFLERVCSLYGCTGVGIDISPKMLLFAKTNHPGFQFILASAEQLP